MAKFNFSDVWSSIASGSKTIIDTFMSMVHAVEHLKETRPEGVISKMSVGDCIKFPAGSEEFAIGGSSIIVWWGDVDGTNETIIDNADFRYRKVDICGAKRCCLYAGLGSDMSANFPPNLYTDTRYFAWINVSTYRVFFWADSINGKLKAKKDQGGASEIALIIFASPKASE